MIHNKIVFILVFSFISGVSLFAQEIVNLNQCLTAGLDNNYSIRIAKNLQQIEANNRSLGNAGFLPSIDAGSNYGGTISNNQQNFRAGGDTSMNGIHNTAATASVSLDWTIFQGFNAQTSYRKLNELKLLGELNVRLSIEDLVASIASEYYFLVQQSQLYRNLEYAVSLSKERLRIDEERYLLGAGSKLQLLQSQVYLNTDSSRLEKLNEVLRASQIRLNKLMASEDPGKTLVPADSSIHIKADLLYDSLYTLTQDRNTSLLIARKNQKVSEYDYKIIASRSYPYLSFSSGYSYNYNKYETGNFKTTETNGLNYGLTLGFNVFDGFNTRREKSNARIEINNQELEYKRINQQVNADLTTLFYAYENNLHLMRLEEQNLKTARENLQIALERFKLGSLSGLELREVQQSLLGAEERLLSVQYDTKLAEISLLQISGSVIEYAKD